jgi:hypothetical protein
MKLVGPDWAVHQLIPGRSRPAGVTGVLHALTEVCTNRGLSEMSKDGSQGEDCSVLNASRNFDITQACSSSLTVVCCASLRMVLLLCNSYQESFVTEPHRASVLKIMDFVIHLASHF